MARLSTTRPGRRTRGVSLVLVLVFITIISAVGAFAVRRAVFGEGLARNMLDVEVARQAAEAALRDAERDLRSPDAGTIQGTPVCTRTTDERPIKTGYGSFNDTCPRGQCRFEVTYYTTSNFGAGTNPEPWWPSTGSYTTLWNNSAASKPPGGSCTFTGGVPLGTFTGAPAMRGVSRQPEYLIEYFKRGQNLRYYRVTARGWGLDPSSEIVLQTYFRPKG